MRIAWTRTTAAWLDLALAVSGVLGMVAGGVVMWRAGGGASDSTSLERVDAVGVLVGAGVLALAAMALWYLRRSGREQVVIVAVVLVSLLFVAGSAAILMVVDRPNPTRDVVGVEVTSSETLDAVLAPVIAAAGADGRDILQVPTGVYIQSFEFLSGANVQVTGYVWQRWPVDRATDAEPGFVLPEAVEDA